MNRIFQQLREQLGSVNRGSHAAVRVHDLRHAFIVRRLLRWQGQGVDIDQAMLAQAGDRLKLIANFLKWKP